MSSIEFPATSVADLIASGGYGFIAPHDTSDPVSTLEDIIDRDTLEPITPWVYTGASREGQGSTFEEAVTTTELRVDQDTAVVFENVNEIVDTLTLQWAEITPAKMAILAESEVDGGSGIGGALAAGDLWGVDGGSFTTRKRFRVVLLGRREPGQGRDITTSDGKVRGEIFGVALQNASISAGSVSIELQRGQLVNITTPFKGYPDPDTGTVNRFVGEHGPETLGS